MQVLRNDEFLDKARLQIDQDVNGSTYFVEEVVDVELSWV